MKVETKELMEWKEMTMEEMEEVTGGNDKISIEEIIYKITKIFC